MKRLSVEEFTVLVIAFSLAVLIVGLILLSAGIPQ
jgi:hypothetical protein